MKLERVYAFLKHCPRAVENGDLTQITVQCPFCGDSQKSNHGHFSIRTEIEPGEPMLYMCYRADCGVKGVLTSKTLEQLGCHNMDTLNELIDYNKTINVKSEKGFTGKVNRNYQLVNVIRSDDRAKLAYLNQRLGVTFTSDLLRKFKIQLSLYDFLNINYIQKLAYKKNFCDLLDEWCVDFISMYGDYMICRDISKDNVIGRRYFMYRTSGKPNKDDMKIYAIPTELDIMNPDPADIHIAEGTFSIIGAYLAWNHKKDHRNSIWLANCGSEYKKTIMHVVKQYGFTDACIHIWSDSEIKMSKYEKLLDEIHDRLNIIKFHVHYNQRAEDFGHAACDIKDTVVKLI